MEMIPADIANNPFAVLSFLAAPAILTNASTLLALSTSNRLARASDRARAASTAILGMKETGTALGALHQKDFQYATQRAQMLVHALRLFYLASGCFAAGTIVALLGAFAGYFGLGVIVRVTEVMTICVAVVGVVSLSGGAISLVRETRIALQVLTEHHAAITTWRATHQEPRVPPMM